MYFFIVQAVRRRGRPVVAEILTWRPDLAGGYHAGMSGKWQFSLAYLFVEVLLFAGALGASRLIFDFWGQEWAHATVMFPLVVAVPVLLCAAIGGVFKRHWTGAITGLGLFLFWFVFLAPRVK